MESLTFKLAYAGMTIIYSAFFYEFVYLLQKATSVEVITFDSYSILYFFAGVAGQLLYSLAKLSSWLENGTAATNKFLVIQALHITIAGIASFMLLPFLYDRKSKFTMPIVDITFDCTVKSNLYIIGFFLGIFSPIIFSEKTVKWVQEKFNAWIEGFVASKTGGGDGGVQ